MSCPTCGNKEGCNFNSMIRACRVCELLDKDPGEKPVCYCETCGVFICQSDWNDPVRRAAAATLEWGHKKIEQGKEIWNHIKRIWE